MTIYFLGGGNMAEAIISGLYRSGSQETIHVTDPSAEKRAKLTTQYGVHTSNTLPELNEHDILVLAVKPQDMQAACENVQHNNALIVSIAAGLPTTTLSHYLKDTQRLIRAMPNTPAKVGLGVTGLFAANGTNEQDKQRAQSLFDASGQTVWLNNETQMHAITAISGSGPAYVFYLLNALQQAAQQQGFDASTARTLALHIFQGAAALAAQSSEEFAVLQQQVTSKGGTTQAALTTFEQHQIAENLNKGVQAAAERSQELAKLP
ncbi:MAG: pyrroline-5-carboxylate reductase [Alysiella sp.]|uniref:pyrroline-5-carboxylate reductase n=1 Tax=Alysiella sp. TaxID=1872483 RepID=UPI0026DD1357|nr:pyrroline-5-carboxylate reductase [Alysiella sp.]MDO4433463.1 pyrroline-5-carboxylate reductase [Alysiella sp.]